MDAEIDENFTLLGGKLPSTRPKKVLTLGDVEDQVETSLREKIRLDEVIEQLEKKSCRKLSEQDYLQVEEKYVDHISTLWIDEGLQQVKDSTDARNILKIFEKIYTVTSFSDCHKLFGGSNSHIDLIFELSKISPLLQSREKKLVFEFKTRSQTNILLQTNSIKYELAFLKSFVEVLKIFESVTVFCERLNVFSVLQHEKYFKSFLQSLLENQYSCPKLCKLQSSANKIVTKSEYFLVEYLRELVFEYLKPVELNECKADGRWLLEVLGKHIVISKELDKIEKHPRFSHIEEVRFVGAGVVHIDADLKSSIWHGKNIVLYSETLIVSKEKQVLWDVTGKDADFSAPRGNAGTSEDGCGLKGEDGNPGESGGNVCIIVESIENGVNLKIVSNGGRGSKGQNGGCGQNGEDGNFIGGNKFKEDFPPVSHILDKEKNYKKTVCNVRQNLASVDICHYGRSEFNVSKEEFCKLVGNASLNDIYFEITTKEDCKIKFSFKNEGFSCCQSFLLYKGALGKEGKAGGAGGLGGKGGLSGDINIQSMKGIHHFVRTSAKNGDDGKMGVSGKKGSSGENGLDRGYMDCTLSWLHSIFSSVTWPILFIPGPNDNSRLTVKFYDESKSNRVLCPYNNRYAEITQIRKTEQAQEFYLNRETVLQDHLYNDIRVQRKKNICSKSIVDQYKEKDSVVGINSIADSLEKTKEALDKLMSEEITESEKITAEVKIKRKIDFCPNEWYMEETSRGLNTRTKNLGTGNFCDPTLPLINTWNIPPQQLVSGRNPSAQTLLSKPQSERAMSNGRKSLSRVVNVPISGIQTVSFQQYSLDKLNFINALSLENTLENSLNIQLKLTDARFLDVAHNNNDVNQVNFRLIERFFCEDSIGSRQEMTQLCAKYNSNDKPLKEALKSFICESENVFQIDGTNRIEELCKDFNNSKHLKELRLKKKLVPLKNLIFKIDQNEHLAEYLLEGILKQCPESKMKFENEIKEDKLLSYMYSAFVQELKRECDWDGYETHFDYILEQFFDCVINKGPLVISFREFLAHHFNTNILVYTLNENGMELKSNHNPKARSKIHFMLKRGKFVKLNFNHDLAKLSEKYKLFNKIVSQFCSFTVKQQVDEYISKTLTLKSCCTLASSEVVAMKINQIMKQENYIKTISNLYLTKQDSDLVKCRLEKLKAEFIGHETILHFMASHFEIEGNRTTVNELCFIVSLILKFSMEEIEVMPQVSWIIAAQPQQCWLVELALLKCELYLKKPLDHDIKFKWRHYMKEPTEKDRLIMFLKKLDFEAQRMSAEALDELLNLLSNVPKAHIGLDHINICEWKYYLKDRFWAQHMSVISDWSEEQLKTLSFYFVTWENSMGNKLCLSLVNAIKSYATKVKTRQSKNLVLETLGKLHSKRFVDVDLFKTLSERSVEEWPKLIKGISLDQSDRSLQQLIKMIQNSDNTSKKILQILPEVEETLELSNKLSLSLKESKRNECDLKKLFLAILDPKKNYSTLDKIKSYLKEITPDENTFQKLISLLLQTLKPSTQCFSFETEFKMLQGNRMKSQLIHQYPNHAFLENNILPFIELSIELKRKVTLRDTQKLTVMTLLKNIKNTLAQVSTGEGKSLIVVTLAIIKALSNEKVNIVTSSKVLAERDVKEYKDVYELCGVTVGHNCSENIDDRKKIYSNCQVIYGDLANFQRDYLLDRVYDKNILGDSSFQTVIVDEVDSMLLDKGNNVLYLSHDIPGLDRLEPVFMYIWRKISRGIPHEEFGSLCYIQTIKQCIMYEIFGVLSKEDLKLLDTSITDKEVDTTWNYLLEKEVILNSGKVLKENINDCNLDNIPESCISKAHLKFIFNKIINRERTLTIPNYLEPFVKGHLESWINSGINAMVMENGRNYVVDVDRSGTSSDRDPIITILDRDTGTDLYNSQWDEALHQFLQLKHGCKLSLMSLKAVFISNVSFLKRYKVLYGLTGTLGSSPDRELLEEMYGTDFVTIPTAKNKDFNEKPSFLYSSTKQWKRKIFQEVNKILNKKRSALIICESIKDVDILKDELSSKFPPEHVHTYTRDYESLNIAEEGLQPGRIIISTNLAGRGTDIKLSEELIKNGGLYVCLSFLPSNYRVEEQAYGRAARNGEPGTAQLIFRSITQSANQTAAKVVDLKKQRDINELKRLEDIKAYHKTQVEQQENWFGKFSKLHATLKKMEQKDEVKCILLESYLNQWAFWLDQNEKLLISNTRTQSINESLECFIAEWTKLGEKEMKNWLVLIKDPVQLVKLGLVFYNQGNLDNSMELFGKVLKEEPGFSEIALYYKVCPESQQKDQKNTYFLEHLKIVAKKLSDRSHSLGILSYEMNWLKEQDTANVIQNNSFSVQQRNICKIYEVILESIYNVIGHEVLPHSFVYPPRIESHMSEDIYSNLITNNLLSKPTIKSAITKDELLFVRDYGLSPCQMYQFIKNLEDKEFIEQQFLKSFKQECLVPCRELFWDELIKNQLLVSEEQFVFVNMQKLKTFHPSLYQKFMSHSNQECFEQKNKLWLYQPEELVQVEVGEKQIFMEENEFHKVIGPNLSQKLWLENKNVVIYNKLAAFSCTKNIIFEHFDSICKTDFQLVDICEETASKIIEDLTSQKIIKEKSKGHPGHYDLLIETENIENINLTIHKSYTYEVRSLMSICFAFRIAFEKLYLLLEDSACESTCIPLQIRLHERIVLDLRQNEIISKTYLKETDPERSLCKLRSLYPKFMGKDGYEMLLSQVSSGISCKSLINILIKNEWLIDKQNGSFYINSKIKVGENQTENKIPKPLVGNPESDTIILTLLNHLNLIENLDFVNTVLTSSKGHYHAFETPSFALSPLVDVLLEKKLTSEIDRFSLNGFDQLIVLREKKWTRATVRNILFVVTLGICGIALGAAISQILCPASPIGLYFIYNGMDDLIFSVSCMISGYFSLKDFFLNKALNVVLSFGKLGLNKLTSTFGQKVVAKPMMKSVAKASCIHIVTAVSQGLVYGALDNVIKPQLQKISDALTDTFYSNMNESLNSHSVKSVFREFYVRFGPDDSKRILNCSFILYTGQFKDKFIKSLKQACSSTKLLVIGSLKIFSHRESTGFELINNVVEVTNNAIKLIKEGSVLYESLEDQITSCLDLIENDLRNVLLQDDKKRNLGSSPTVTKHNSWSIRGFDDFTLSVFDDWEKELKHLLSDSLDELVLSPALQFVSNSITEWSSKCILKNKMGLTKPNNLRQQNCSEYKGLQSKKKQNSIANSDDYEYEECLLDLLKKKRNVSVYAEILRKNLPIDTHFVEMCCFILPKALESTGVAIPNLEIIVERNGTHKIFSTTKKLNDNKLTIIIAPDSDLCTNILRNKKLIQYGVDEILTKIGQEYPILKGYAIETLRDLVAAQVESVFGTQPSFPTFHCNPTQSQYSNSKINTATEYKFLYKRFQYGGRQVFNMNLNVDLLTEEKLSFGKKIEDFIFEGFGLALEKINNHIHTVQCHLRNFNLLLEDFEASKYEIVPETRKAVAGNFHCFATCYTLTIPFVVDCIVNCVEDFSVTMKLNNYVEGENPNISSGPYITYEISPKVHFKYLNKGTKGHVLLNKECSEPSFSSENCHAAGELISQLSTCQLKKPFRTLIIGDSMFKHESKVTSYPNYAAISFLNIAQLKSKIGSLARQYKGLQYVILIPSTASTAKSEMNASDTAMEVAGAVNIIQLEFGNVKIVLCGLLKGRGVNFEKVVQTNRHLKRYVNEEKLNSLTFMRLNKLLSSRELKKNQGYLDKYCLGKILQSLS